MFKVITDGVDTPTLFLLCDGPCSHSATMAVNAGMEEHPAAHQEFAVAAVKSGWLVRLDKQYCPMHAAKQMEQKRLVEPVNFALKN